MIEALLKVWRPLCHVQFGVMLVIYTLLGLTRNTGHMLPEYNDLSMHFVGYVVAGVSISFAWPRSAYWQRGLFLLTYSVAIEVAQHFRPPRTFDWWDILANACGILVGLGLFALLKVISPPAVQPLLR